MCRPTLIIAEIGINHNGDPELARQAVHAAHAAGAGVVKFHTYHADDVMIPATPLADYMRNGSTTTFYELARTCELTDDTTRDLIAEATALGIEFVSSPFDVASVGILARLGLQRLKVPSGELVNPLLLRALAATGLPLIVSTGMATLEEVEWAVELLARHGAGPVTLLHCVSQYPAAFEHVNLRAMRALADRFDLPVGFSDHTPGIEASIAAVALGATVIEKHLTLDRSLPGPDHQASLTPPEFADLVRAIRHIEEALGDGIKRPAAPELDNRLIVRKSLVFTHDQPAGVLLEPEMVTAKRPGTGIPARELPRLLRRRLRRPVRANDMVLDSDVE